MHCFFLDFRKETSQRFASVFSGGTGEGGEFAAKWGWYPALYTLAGEDILQMDKVTELSVGHVLTHLAFLKDLHFQREQQLKRQRA